MQIDKFTAKKWISIGALLMFGVLLLFLLSNFIAAFLGAIIFYVLFTPFMNRLTQKYHWKDTWAAVLIILLSFVIILIPIFSLSYLLYAKITQILSTPDAIHSIFLMLDERVNEALGVELFSNQNIQRLQESTGKLIPTFLNQLLWTLGNIALMYFILYYLLIQRKRIVREVKTFLPFDKANITILSNELESMTLSNLIGVPAICLIQGSAAALGYFIFGLKEPVFWGVITAFVSLVPLIGSTMIWFPAGIFLIATGQTWPGIGLLIYGLVVIINIDNIARFMIQKRFADVHPVITVFGVIIGLGLFGLPGLVFGPLMLSYFIIFIQMYRKIYKADQHRHFP